MGNFITAFLIIIIGTSFFFFILTLFDARRLRRLRKKYNPDDDKSKQGEQRRNLTERSSGVKRFTQLEPRELLQTTTPSPVGKDNPSIRKTSRRLRGIFKTLRRK